MATTTKKATATKTSPLNGAALAIANAVANLAAAKAALTAIGLFTLTPAQRQDSTGKLRTGEPVAMTNVLDVMDLFPGLFESLADKDGGVDDTKVETAPSRANLALFAELAPLAAELEALRSEVSDTMLTAAEAAKEVTVPAYAIIRANAPANPKVAKAAATAIAFYNQSAKQRASNLAKLARAAKKAAPKPVA